MSDKPRATVHVVDGQLVLDDPNAIEMIEAVIKHNGRESCKALVRENADRMRHFFRRVAETGRTPATTVITLLMVDDPIGGPIADALMPGFDWQPIRDKGQIPIARGLADRAGLEEIVDLLDRAG